MTVSDPTSHVEFNFHGIIGVQLVDSSANDAAVVRRQLGDFEAELDAQPDVIIRFVERLTTSPSTRLLGAGETSFTDDAFIVLVGGDTENAGVEISFDQIGGQCEIICESGLRRLPLLMPILNVIALSKGAVAVHASAFTYNGTGVLAAGWARGGKTSLLLAFMARGAQYISDDWAYISPDGLRIYGVADRILVRHSHLVDLPQYRAVITKSARTRLRMMKALHLLGRSLPPSKWGRLVTSLIEHRMVIPAFPEVLFGRDSCALAGALDKVFLSVSHAKPSVIVEQVDPRDVARRLAFSLQHERLDLLSYYLRFRFAFPDRPNALIDGASALERETLSRLLLDKDAYMIYHPFPPRASDLFDAVVPHLSRSAS